MAVAREQEKQMKVRQMIETNLEPELEELKKRFINDEEIHEDIKKLNLTDKHVIDLMMRWFYDKRREDFKKEAKSRRESEGNNSGSDDNG